MGVRTPDHSRALDRINSLLFDVFNIPYHSKRGTTDQFAQRGESFCRDLSLRVFSRFDTALHSFSCYERLELSDFEPM